MLKLLKEHSILYVEDEPEIQRNIQEYLQSYFKMVYVSSNGKDAQQQYIRYRPDVLLLDINLPYLDGLSLAKEIRRKDQNIKIVMLTAYAEQDKLLQATELKLTKYLIKPVSPQEFKQTMLLLSNELMQNPSRFLTLCDQYIWDKELQVLQTNTTTITLKEKEHRLLRLFISKQRNKVSYEDIMIAVWDNSLEDNISIDSVKNQVSQLRKTLPKLPLENIYGQGYILR